MNTAGTDGTPSCQHGCMHGCCQCNYRGAVLGRAFLLWVLCSPIQISQQHPGTCIGRRDTEFCSQCLHTRHTGVVVDIAQTNAALRGIHSFQPIPLQLVDSVHWGGAVCRSCSAVPGGLTRLQELSAANTLHASKGKECNS